MPLFPRFREAVLHLFFPRLCEGCRAPLLYEERMLCLSCLQQMPRTRYHHLSGNETALRFAGRFPFVQATSYAYFVKDGLLQHLLHGLKYHGKKDNGVMLGELFGYELKDLDWIRTVDCMVPVPLHARKLALRGYNQSVLIAEGLSRVLNIPVLQAGLLRNRHTETQTHKSRAERVENVSGAFSLGAALKSGGLHVLLVDDVLTTGATLESCAEVLLRVGCRVSMATVGIASE